jgi:hypothetical protein
MQQATVNLFADMGVQPAILQTGLKAATASTDKTPPSSTIAAPVNHSTVAVSKPVAISGTATDTGGGVVAGVEVSVDGGATWHPATGRASWTYTFTPASSGTITLRSRAVDDSGNLETPTAGVTISVALGCGLGGVELAPILPLLLGLWSRRHRKTTLPDVLGIRSNWSANARGKG